MLFQQHLHQQYSHNVDYSNSISYVAISKSIHGSDMTNLKNGSPSLHI